MSTARDEAEAVETSDGTARYCLKRSLKLSTVGDNIVSRRVNEDGALFDSGFDGGRGFPVSPETGGISLESALRDFGPAAIDDLIPRLHTIAATLDAAH